MFQLFKEAMKIHLHSHSIIWEEGFKLSQAWNPAVTYYKPMTLTVLIIMDGVARKIKRTGKD
jgi:hypothetical protein